MKFRNKLIAAVAVLSLVLAYLPLKNIIVFAADIAMPKVAVIEAENTNVLNNLAYVKSAYIRMVQGIHNAGTVFETKDTYEIPAGTYKVVSFIRLNGTPTGDNILAFDILAGGSSTGNAFITKGQFKNNGSFERIEIQFTLSQALTGAKFRMYNFANASVDIDKLEIFKSDVQYAALDAGSGALGTTLATYKDDSNNILTGKIDGVGIRVDKTQCQTTQTQATYGWGGTLNAGNYKMIVRMKLIEGTGNASNPVVMVNTNSAQGQSGIVTLHESDFPQLNTFYDIVVPLDFTSGNRTTIEPYIWKLSSPAHNTSYLIDSITFADNDFDSTLITSDAAETLDPVTNIEAETSVVPAGLAEIKSKYIHIDPSKNTAGTVITGSQKYTIEPGHYYANVYVRILSTPTQNHMLTFDIYCKKGSATTFTGECGAGILLSQFKNNGSFERVRIEFNVTETLNYAQFRLYNHNTAIMDIDRMEIYKDNVFYNCLDSGSGAAGTLITTETDGGEVKTGKIAGVGVRIDKTSTQTQKQAIFGSVGNLKAGKYKAIARIKLIEGTGNANNVVTIFTANSAQGQLFNQSPIQIKESDFPELNTFYDIVIPFEIDSDRTSFEPYLWKLNPDANSTTYLIDSITVADASFSGALVTDKPDNGGSNPPVLSLPAGVFGQNAIDIAGTGGTVSGNTVECDPTKNSAGIAVKSDLTNIKSGKYRVIVYASLLAATTSGNVFEVELVNESGTSLGKKTIDASKLSTTTKAVMVNFDISADTKASIQVNNLDTIGFKLTQVHGFNTNTNGDFSMVPKDDSTCGQGCERTTNDSGSVISPQTSNPGHTVIASKFATIAPGKNLFLFKIRQLSAASGAPQITNIDFAAKGKSSRYQLKTVSASDFTTLNEWKTIKVEFYSNEWLEDVQIAMYNYGNASWEVNDIDILDEVAAKEYIDSLPPEPILDIASQNTEGSQVGTKTPSGLILAEGMGSAHAIYGNNITSMAPGNYRAVIYAKIYNKSGNVSTPIITFDLYGKYAGDSAYKVQFSTPIYETSFEKTNTYYAIEIPITIDKTFQDVQMRMYFHDNGTSIKINRHMICQQGVATPAAVQVPDEEFKRPDGITPVSKVDVPITSDNVVFASNDSGHVVDGRIEFRTATDQAGGVQKLKNDLYLTSGQKTVRIYIRTPNSTAGGSYTFARISIMQGYFPLKTLSITGDTLMGYVNRPYVYETTITADENAPLNLKVNWFGNYDFIIDKVVIKDDDSPDGKDIKVNAEKVGTDNIATINRADTANVSAVDNFVIAMDGMSIKMPTTEIVEWLSSYDKVEVIIGKPDDTKTGILQALADNYQYDVKMLKMYDIGIKLYRGTEASVKTSINNPYTVTVSYTGVLPQSMHKDYLMGFCSYLGNSTRPGAMNSTINNETAELTFTSSSLGTFYVGITDLYELLSPEGTDNPNNKNEPTKPVGPTNPPTNDVFNYIQAILTLMTGGLIIVLIRKKYSYSK